MKFFKNKPGKNPTDQMCGSLFQKNPIHILSFLDFFQNDFSWKYFTESGILVDEKNGKKDRAFKLCI